MFLLCSPIKGSRRDEDRHERHRGSHQPRRGYRGSYDSYGGRDDWSRSASQYSDDNSSEYVRHRSRSPHDRRRDQSRAPRYSRSQSIQRHRRSVLRSDASRASEESQSLGDHARKRSESQSKEADPDPVGNASASNNSGISVPGANLNEGVAPVDPTSANPSIPTQTTAPTGQSTQEPTEVGLDPDILEILGDRVYPDRKLAPPVHSTFAQGIEEIIKKGLPSDKRKTLLGKFPSPKNCLFMDPPKLNPEVKGCLQEAILKRDSRIVEKQVRLTAGLAGVLDVFTKVTSLKNEDKVPAKELSGSLWGILQLLADLQHEESIIRRSLILKNVVASHKEALNTTTVDEWLFGEKLEDKVKAIKALESTVKVLKPTSQQTSSAQGNHLKNWKGPPRRQSYKQTNVSTSGGRKMNQKPKYQSRRSTHDKSSHWTTKKRN